MRWKDILKLMIEGKIHEDDIVFVYDESTGEELPADLIEFDDTGEIMIVINPDSPE